MGAIGKTFAMSNGSRKYKLNRDLYNLKQNNTPVNVYYTTMISMWEELDVMNVLPNVTEANVEIRSFFNTITTRGKSIISVS